MLEKLGITFENRKEKSFWNNIQLLEEFIKENKHIPLITDKFKGFNLGLGVQGLKKIIKRVC